MSIGVEYDTFWRLTPRLLNAFIKADLYKKRMREFEMYVEGRYVFDAVSLALANGFRKKGTRPMNWLEEPYRMVEYTEEEKAAMAKAERERLIQFLNSMIDREGGCGDGDIGHT